MTECLFARFKVFRLNGWMTFVQSRVIVAFGFSHLVGVYYRCLFERLKVADSVFLYSAAVILKNQLRFPRY